MGTAERRQKIMRILCYRRHETIQNLSFEFGVSERTIQRDIEILSLSEPIYTQSGRYGGGVYVDGGYKLDRMYMKENELAVLNKLLKMSNIKSVCDLSKSETAILQNIISQYTKI